MVDRKGNKERCWEVRSWSGETLGRSSYLNNSKQKQIYIYICLRNRERNGERNRERGDTQKTFARIFIHATQMQGGLIKSKVKDYLLKNTIKQIQLPKV